MASLWSPRRIMLYSLVILFLAAVSVAVGVGCYLIRPADPGAGSEVFMVPHGASLNSVAAHLERQGLIRAGRIFAAWARIMGYGTGIKAGEYRLSGAMPPVKILEILRAGIIVTHSVTIPEGFTAGQIGDVLEQKGLARKKEFEALASNPEAARHFGISGPGLEGYLYPDTYQFGRGLSPMALITVMVTRYMEVFEPFRARAEEAGLTMERVTTLASIVEKETGRAEERPLIAGVFLNRLKRNMRLESDPTVIYGLSNFDGNLRKRDLTRHSPYNTYVIRGLPPGPIANPGREAIRAVLYPAVSEYLYFVSKNDGSHHFSATFTEHTRAVRRYQKRR